jgi:succinyl-CoA synthetase alpha subunit
MSILIDKSTKILILGITGREAISITQDTLDYGGHVVAGVTPGKGGRFVHGIPVYNSVKEAQVQHVINAAIICVPVTAAKIASFECITNNIPLILIVTERIPQFTTAQIVEYARLKGSMIIGPNSMGLISPGKGKLGGIGGPAKDTKRTFQPGSIGIMSRSGGMTTEIANLLSLNGKGVSTAISIGGDPIIGSTFADLLPLFEKDPATSALVTFSEPGGGMEAELAKTFQKTRSKLKIISFLAGNFMSEMPGVRFGHAGSLIRTPADSIEAKAAVLQKAGIQVATQLSDIPKYLKSD